MLIRVLATGCLIFCAWICASSPAAAQTGRRFPSEKKTVTDAVTGVPLTLLTTGPSSDAKIYQDHPHPTFSADSTRILIQSALAASDNRALDLIVIPVPKTWLGRQYSSKAPK